MPTTQIPWYIARNNQKLGPFAWTQIQQMAAGGMLQVTDMLWQESGQEGQEVSDFLMPRKDGPGIKWLAKIGNYAISNQNPSPLDLKPPPLTFLRKLPPNGFERLCQRLLRASGFEHVEVTGRCGDGGIDGIGIMK